MAGMCKLVSAAMVKIRELSVCCQYYVYGKGHEKGTILTATQKKAGIHG